MMNCKICVRNLHRRLPSTIPHKILGFFDGNLGTYCICNESAASTSSFPFWVVETRSCKRFKKSRNFCKNGLSHVTFWFFFQNFPRFVYFCDEKFQGLLWFLKSILFSISSKIPGFFSPFINISSLHKYIFPFINTSSPSWIIFIFPFMNDLHLPLHKYIFPFINTYCPSKNVSEISIGGFPQPFLKKFWDFLMEIWAPTAFVTNLQPAHLRFPFEL